MWSTSGEPPGIMEGEEESPEHMAHAKEKCEQNKSQLESLKEIMLKNKQSLKKKEEEVQEYARRLSKIKSRSKFSRRSKDTNLPSKDVPHSFDATLPDTSEGTIDDISQAKTAKAKSTLLQKKLAENRKVFEQRNKELTETKRAVEEKVEAIRQQLEEKDVSMVLQRDQLPVTPIKPIMVTSDVMSPIQIEDIQEKENKITELGTKILELEATIIDLQENLKEKDSVIESKTKAVTLMSADLSKKGKTTLDTLEDTKDEMRTMQEHFVLLETSLKNKNENLLEQLQDRDNKIAELEESINRFEQQVNEQKISESASADFSRSTMDNLLETKEAMKSMQENFVLVESSLKAKNDNLLQQLKDYELKLAESNERIFKLESGIGIERDPTIEDLQFKLGKLEQNNKQLQDERYELQKNVAELQDKIVNMSAYGNNGVVMEKDNRIAELESLVEELKQSNTLLEEESKAELQKQVADLTLKNEEYSNKINDLENVVHDLEVQKNNLAERLPDENTLKEDEKVLKLTKDLEDLNKAIIKMKAQHKNKLKNLQKQLENFKMVSDANAELVRLGNQVALLEEEKGNLQLSLVDFDELKASAGDWQDRIADLESKVSAQAKEIQMQIEAIAALENQKLDLMQELHAAKQEVSALEAENAESENHRVTAEMKVVDLEEQLEAMHKLQSESKLESSSEVNQEELLKRIEVLTQENSELYNRISKMEEKGASDTGSTESFEAIQELDKHDLLKKIEDLTQKNNELTIKLSKYEEKENLQTGSTESFVTISDADKNELLKKIDQLMQENTDLTMKLSRVEEKGSSDTGSTESFERILEHNEGMSKIELLTQENNELVIKLTKLEEQLEYIEQRRTESTLDSNLNAKVDELLEENNGQSLELSKLKVQVTNLAEENNNLQKQIEILIAEANDFIVTQSQSKDDVDAPESSERSKREIDYKAQIHTLTEQKNLLEKEIKELQNTLAKSENVTTQDLESNDLKPRLEELLKENHEIHTKVSELETFNKKLQEDLNDVIREKEELHTKVNKMLHDDSSNDKLELTEKLEKLNLESQSVAQEKQELHEQITLLRKSHEEISKAQQSGESVSQQKESMIVASLEHEIEECKKLIAEQTGLIEEMKIKLSNKEKELEEKGNQIIEYQTSGKNADTLENELKEMHNTIEEWKFKCNEMQEKMEKLEAGKASIEEGFKMLQNENEMLLEEKKEKDAEVNLLKQQLQDTTTLYESKLQEQLAEVSAKENEIVTMKQTIEDKNQELRTKYTELQNTMITLDSLQDECNRCKMLVEEKDTLLTSTSEEVARLNDAVRNKEEEIYSLKADIIQLNDKMQESKPLKDYNVLLEQLRDKDMILDDTQCKLNATTKENNNLLEKMKIFSQQNNDIQNQLAEKQREFADLVEAKEYLESQVSEFKNDKSEAEKRIWELQSILDNNSKFVEDLQIELRDGYKQIEQLKLKHIEDMNLQNQSLENLIEELTAKTQECEALKDELQEKERLIGQSLTEDMKVALEAKISDLEQKLKDSEEKIQMQSEKMKKIYANLKKKTTMCQELETRVAELEEKWTTEKDEKEVKNKQIQDVEMLMREKDNRITDLEERLIQARNESAEAFKNIDKLTGDLTSSTEKINLLMQQVTEMGDEIVQLRGDLVSMTSEVEAEKEAKQNLIAEYEAYKQQVAAENERKQQELDEARENARELNVRMQVMESEYVEQLALINFLIAGNGLLQSKQVQLNEKLEDVEKQSEERRTLLEQMQKVVNTATETTQTTEEQIAEDDTKMAGVQHCSHCEQCQTLVQALEAKLQEREAEIENLDNELANSIGNFVQMRETLRMNDLMHQTSVRNGTFEKPYNDLLLEYNTLTWSHEEVKIKLDEALKENKELADKIEALQSANSTLEEKVSAAEQTLENANKDAENLQNAGELNSDLLKKCEEREAELMNVQQQLKVIQERAEQLEQQLNSQTLKLESEEEQRTQVERLLQDTKDSLEREIATLKSHINASQKRVEDLTDELEASKNQSVESVERPAASKEAPTFDRLRDEQDTAPQLFDASKIFGSSFVPDSNVSNDRELKRLQNLLDEKEAQCSNLTQEINHLQALMHEEKTQMSQNYSQCVEELEVSREQLRAAQGTLQKLEQALAEKDVQLESLNVELRNVSIQIIEQQNDTDNKLKEVMIAKDNQIEELKTNLNSTKEILDKMIAERDQQNAAIDSYRLQIATLEAELRNSTDSELIQDLESRVSDVRKERDLLHLQVNDLSRSMEELKDSMEKVVHERDEAKEVVVNLTRALDDAYKNSDKTPTMTDTSTKESTPLEDSMTAQTQGELDASKPTTEQAASLEAEALWDVGSTEKLNVDEETWDWNADDAQLMGDQQLPTTLVPSTEMQLRAKVDELQDQIKDFEKEKEKILEDNKAAQLKSAKVIKKLKEYKVQIENLQQQLKIQRSTSDFYELDSAIEEELKSQIVKLEKTLSEAREEQKNTISEKEALMKRLDVVVSANDRYLEMKEKQDMEMDVLRIRNKELSDKIQALDKRLQESGISLEGKVQTDSNVEETKQTSSDHRQKRSLDGQDFENVSKKYEEQIERLKDDMEALATENEQLQHFLEDQKMKIVSLESKRTADENESIQIVDELNQRISELRGMLSKSREEYDLLRKQYEQSLMDANDQVSAMRQNADYFKEETYEKTSKFEMEINYLRQQVEASESNTAELQRNLQEVLREKTSLEEQLTSITASSEKQLSAVNASMAEVTDLLNIRIQEVADLKQELQRQYVDHEEAEMKLQDAIQELTRELNEKKQQVESLKKSVTEKENEFIQQQSVETVSALVSQATQELMQKHAIEIEEKEKEIRLLSERMSTLETTTTEQLQKKETDVSRLNTQQEELEFLKQHLMERESIIESLQSNLASLKEQLDRKEFESSEHQTRIHNISLETHGYIETIAELQKRLNNSEVSSINDVQEYILRIQNLEQELQSVRNSLVEKETTLERYVQESTEYKTSLENSNTEINELRSELQKIDVLKNELLEKTEQINRLNSELESTRSVLEETKRTLKEKQTEFDRLSSVQHDQHQHASSNIVDGLPLFRMGDDNHNLQRTIDTMQVELAEKQSEIEHLKYILNENTYPSIIQEMQDRINCLYNEKAELESSLEMATVRDEENIKQIRDMQLQIETQNQEFISKEDGTVLSRERRSVKDQEEIVRLQNELHAKEQEINDLKYIIAEKDSQLSLQASMEPQSDDFELRETVQRLTGELYGKEQEIQHLKATITELQKEVSRLQQFERLSEETKEAIQKLSLEKEQVRVEVQEFLEAKLKEKEAEIDEIKQRLSIENNKILDELQLRDRDIKNLKKQLEESSMVQHRISDTLRQKDEEYLRVSADLAEKERRLAELSITKDTELHNLKVQIHEKDVRIEELLALSDEEEKQLNDLKSILEAREIEINSLKNFLEEKVKEHEYIQNILKKDVPIIDTSATSSTEPSVEEGRVSTLQELDLALYMLHQRDVRCEELTQELMQLLEERDTLQLRLSNAIKVNEELRKMSSIDFSPTKEASTSDSLEPLVENPSPSKSEGPVEIAKEAIDSPIGEDKATLALKLSQLHTVSHSKDVRLRDERELRHTQQMSLLAHKDVLSTLPPEAAAKLVSANYTLSRDVQSQSSVLLNWLWGKSTPKVVHM